MTYAALFESDEEKGGYVVTFPDFGYGVTQGENMAEAERMARDLLAALWAISSRRRRTCRSPAPTARIEAAFRALGKTLVIDVKDAA